MASNQSYQSIQAIMRMRVAHAISRKIMTSNQSYQEIDVNHACSCVVSHTHTPGGIPTFESWRVTVQKPSGLLAGLLDDACNAATR